MRYEKAFTPVIGSTVTSFNSTLGSASVAYAIESTLRKWQGPQSRSVRLSPTARCYAMFGSSTVVAAVGTGMMVTTTPEVFSVGPSVTYVAFASSTDTIVNVTPGYGA